MGSFFEDEIDRADQQKEGGYVVPSKRKVLEENQRKDREYDERDHFLDHFQLHQVERTAFAVESDAVGRHLETILEESHRPTDKDDDKQRRLPGTVLPEKTQMTVPGHRHKGIRKDEQPNSENDRLHIIEVTPFPESPVSYRTWLCQVLKDQH